jgi:hypothetical protein
MPVLCLNLWPAVFVKIKSPEILMLLNPRVPDNRNTLGSPFSQEIKLYFLKTIL